MIRARHYLAALAVVFVSMAAADEPQENHYVETPWLETEVALPAYPQPQNLVEFDADAGNRNHFSIDVATLTVGSDGVVHYVVVITSPSGAHTVSFEGMHCSAREYKVYAIGRDDRSWAGMPSHAWTLIENKGINNYRAALNRDFLCPYGSPVASADAVRRSLQQQRN